jgi:cytochrome c556
MKSFWIAGALVALTATSALALDVAGQVKARQEGMKAIGGASKGLYDTLGGDKDPAKLKDYAARINTLAGQTGGWFPAGTGPSSGVKTKARAEIWTDAAGFAAARAAFVTQAGKLNAAAQTGDAAKVQAEFGALRGTCKGCHEKYQDK